MKVSDISFDDAKKVLATADQALQTAAKAFAGAKGADADKALDKLRTVALNWSKAERDARTARDREAKAKLGALI